MGPSVLTSMAPAAANFPFNVGVSAAMPQTKTPRGAMGLSAFTMALQAWHSWQTHGTSSHSPHGPAEEAAGVAGGVALDAAITSEAVS